MIALLLAGVAIAQAPLQPFSLLVGHCWSGPAPGDQGTDKHCFESVYGGQHIRDRHVVTVQGRAVYEGETLYSAKGQQVIFTYWNSIGGVGTGLAKLNGDNWQFSGTMHASSESEEIPLQANWKVSAEGYQVIDPDGKARLFRRAD